MKVEIERLDAHAADIARRSLSVEVPDEMLLSSLLSTVLVPFFRHAPGATWICRGLARGGWQDFAELVTSGDSRPQRALLLVPDVSLHAFVGDDLAAFAVACRPD